MSSARRTADIAIVGAGPYGLSIAAHLRTLGIDFRIFGTPMELWRERMPAAMKLKSEGFASNLYDSDHSFTLKRYCEEHRIPYADVGDPVRLDTLVAYGLSFQQMMVPELEPQKVVTLERTGGHFTLLLENGERADARQVIVAVGIGYYDYIPACLRDLPQEFATHSSVHQDLRRFSGREVTVIGGGASAIDLAVLLREAGADVRIVVRGHKIHFLSRPALDRSFWMKLRRPQSGLGYGIRTRVYQDAPMLFRYLPHRLRLEIVRTFLGPAGSWHTKDQVVGAIPVITRHEPRQAELRGNRVHLRLGHRDGGEQSFATDHVIAATGYKVDLARLSFLTRELLSQLTSVQGTPVLSGAFESSVPGLYFVGISAAASFGPVMRFMLGARYTAHRLTRHLARRPAASERDSRALRLDVVPAEPP
jgi:thioredoxin reductase